MTKKKNPDRPRLDISRGILFTDFYQLTMAQLYFRNGMHDKEAQFDYFFRKYPDYGEHRAGYCINAGTSWLQKWIQEARFYDEEIEFLKSQKTKTNTPLFSNDFLNWLKKDFSFDELEIASVDEGRVVHPDTPVAAIRGPLAVAQILESSFLNHMNFQTLIATKACRIYESGCRSLMIDFGLRRSHGYGANEAARSALIGGADFTSNTGISKELGFPPKGTHAHSMVQAFIASGGTELDAFRQYASVYPDDCLLLVDTINTLKSGVPNAIKVFKELKEKGHEPVGIRLDSGDLAYLAIKSAKMLDKEGLGNVSIVLSNQLDEIIIWQIISQIRNTAGEYGLDPETIISRLSYGVGTSLVTSKGNPALDGVYKLTALKNNERWEPAFKLSETAAKRINPGRKKLWRIYDREGKAEADVIGLNNEELTNLKEIKLFHPIESSVNRTLKREEISAIEPLLKKWPKKNEDITQNEIIENCRIARKKDLNRLHTGVKRLINPHIYHVSLTENVKNLKERLKEKHGEDD